MWIKLTGVRVHFYFLMRVKVLQHAADWLIRKEKIGTKISFHNEAVLSFHAAYMCSVFVGSHSEMSRDTQKSHLFLFFSCSQSLAAFSEGLAGELIRGGFDYIQVLLWFQSCMHYVQ